MDGILAKAIEDYNVHVERDAATGPVTYEAWRKDSELHRADGPARIWRDAATGTVTTEEWWKDGELHREGAPAIIRRDAATGTVTTEEWWKDSELHREGAPAIIRRDAATGTVTLEVWCRNGMRLRGDAYPALSGSAELTKLTNHFEKAVKSLQDIVQDLNQMSALKCTPPAP